MRSRWRVVGVAAVLLAAVSTLAALALGSSSASATGYRLVDGGGDPVLTGTRVGVWLPPYAELRLVGTSPRMTRHCDTLHLEARLTANDGSGIEATIPAGSGPARHDPDYEVLFQRGGHAPGRCETAPGECDVAFAGYPVRLVVRDDNVRRSPKPEVIIEHPGLSFTCLGVTCIFKGSIEGQVHRLGDVGSGVPPRLAFPNPSEYGTTHLQRVFGSGLFCPDEGTIDARLALIQPRAEFARSSD